MNKLKILQDALKDILGHKDNVVDTRGHESVLLRKHPEPCCDLDFCVMHDMERRMKKAQEALNLSLQECNHENVEDRS